MRSYRFVETRTHINRIRTHFERRARLQVGRGQHANSSSASYWCAANKSEQMEYASYLARVWMNAASEPYILLGPSCEPCVLTYGRCSNVPLRCRRWWRVQGDVTHNRKQLELEGCPVGMQITNRAYKCWRSNRYDYAGIYVRASRFRSRKKARFTNKAFRRDGRVRYSSKRTIDLRRALSDVGLKLSKLCTIQKRKAILWAHTWCFYRRDVLEHVPSGSTLFINEAFAVRININNHDNNKYIGTGV